MIDFIVWTIMVATGIAISVAIVLEHPTLQP